MLLLNHCPLTTSSVANCHCSSQDEEAYTLGGLWRSALSGQFAYAEARHDRHLPVWDLKKARAHVARTGLPTFAMDGGLYIDAFPPDKQPGVRVRRMVGEMA